MKAPSRWGRRVLRSDRLRRLLCWAVHVYIRFVYLTNRWTVEGADIPQRLRHDGSSFVLAFWHGRLLMIPMAWQRLAPMHMLISAHRDGRIIADAVTYFGVDSIPGSTRRGGSAALRTMMRCLDRGECVGITPDGPRGPAAMASAGIVNVARLAGVPIVPIVFSTSRRRVLRTWDRFQFAFPFGRGAFIWGEPIEVARNLDEAGIEATRGLVETRMNEIAAEADRRVGHTAAPHIRPNLWTGAYRALTIAASPLVRLYLRLRCRRGKEDPNRLPERFGVARAARPEGPLVWVHAASIGEAQSVLALVGRILDERPAIEVLMTTGTVASARLLADRLPPRARHQYVPVDLAHAVDRFLDHWRPDLAIWVESELWPNLVLETCRRGIPMVLANGRLSNRSLARWRSLPRLVGSMLGSFTLCLAQDDEQAARFRDLGAANVASIGDLKTAAPPLAVEPDALDALRRQIGARPVWLAASTHPGEEEVIAEAHRSVAATAPGLLTLIVPRHPVRGPGIADMLASRGLRVARRAAGEPVDGRTQIYLADTLGELGLFFRAAGIAFIGGSLARKGGHNPFEAARLDCVVLHGPDMANCVSMAAALDAAGAALPVTGSDDLATAVSRLLADPAERNRRSSAAARVALAGDGTLDAVIQQMAPWLDALAPIVDVLPPEAAPVHARAARVAARGADARS